MKKIKWNYAIIRSIFGDYWIGKTKLKANEQNIFSNLADAINFAEQLFEDSHPEFDSNLEEGDEGYNEDLYYTFEQIREHAEDKPEIINKKLEKFITK